MLDSASTQLYIFLQIPIFKDQEDKEQGKHWGTLFPSGNSSHWYNFGTPNSISPTFMICSLLFSLATVSDYFSAEFSLF